MPNLGIGTWPARRRVKSRGEVAVVHGDAELTYDELADRSARLAAALAERGVAHGTRVAYLGENHPAFIETLFACGLLGALFVPLNTRLAPPEVEYALEDSAADVFVFSEALRDLARKGAWSSRVTHRIVVGGPGDDVTEAYDELVAAARPFAGEADVSPADGAIILYTSGTTGRPKGAVLTHGNLTWNCINVLVDYDVSSTTVALLISPLFHAAALGMGLLPVLLKGGCVVLHERFEPAAVLRDIERHRVTALSGVPTTYQLLAEHPDWAGADLSSLTMLTCGGSAVPERVMAAYESRGLGFSSGYGMTETSPGATSLRPSRSREHMGSSGLPHFFTAVRIAGPDGGELPAGEVGEILIQGPNVIREYWRRPESTAESRHGEWFRSGDLGHVDHEGYLFVSDRSKDMIISGGENVYPAEIEHIVMEIGEVDGAAVIGVPDERWGEVPVAIISTKNGARLADGAIGEHLAGRVARYKIPKAVAYVDELPRTASGKVRKPDLRKRFPTMDAVRAGGV